MQKDAEENERTVSAEQFRDDPEAVIGQAFEHGSVVVEGDEPSERIRFAIQSYDIELD